jgi:photosystem II stability/assembly factor-like uncharacterized protein
VSVTTPPRRPETEHDRDLERRVSDLEALIEEARRRARRRRFGIGAALVLAAAGVAGLSGVFGGGGGARATPLAGDSGAKGQSSGPTVPLAPLPDHNEASAFAFDPRHSNVVYVASRDANGGVYVFKTTDNGRHWRLTGARGAGWRSDDLSLTADPLHSGTLYAGTDTAVYKTVNGGRSWKPFRQGLFPRPPYPYYGTPGKTDWNRNNGWVLAVAVDPSDRSVVYAAAGGIRKSKDDGHTWERVFKPKRWGMVSRIAIAPTRPEAIYAIAHDATGATAIYKSTDAGRTWQITGSGSSLPSSCCGDNEDALAVDPRNPQTLYADVGNTVFATTDGGASWQHMANGLPAHDVWSLTVNPSSGTVYASATVGLNHVGQNRVLQPAGAIYETTDGGRTWNEIFTSIGVGPIAVDPARPSTIYASGWGPQPQTHNNKMRLLRSTNGGRTWAISR